LWLPFWLAIYRHPCRHPAVTPADLAQLDVGEPNAARPAWRDVLRQRPVWGLVLSRLTPREAQAVCFFPKESDLPVGPGTDRGKGRSTLVTT
jgi:hypothetical protein